MCAIFYGETMRIKMKKSFKSSSWTTLDKFDLIRVFDEYNVCVCKRRTIKELMVFSTLVVS